MKRHALVVMLAVASAVTSCAKSDDRSDRRAPTPTGPAPTAPAPAPGSSWTTASPASLGLDPSKLNEIASTAEKGHSRCLVVVRHAKVAGQWYFMQTGPTFTQDVFSVTKSITSILVGIAQDDGRLRIDDPASKWITEWRGTPSAGVTVRDLLSNDSGREWSPAIDYQQLIQARDRTEFAIGLKQADPPGTVWAYNNAAIQTLQRVLAKATGEDVVRFARERLFGPLGMTHTTMTTDQAGNAQTFEGVRSSCLDLARFGQMLLNDGRFGSRQIVSAAYVRAATGPSSTKLNAAYGYLFWLNHEGPIGNPLAATDLSSLGKGGSVRGRLVPGAPDDLFWALGLGNQLVQVDRASDTVVVRLGTGVARPQPPTFGPTEASKVVTTAVVGP